MIAFLQGRLFSKQASEAIIDCSGVGYSVNISMNTYEKLPEVGKDTFLNTHLIIREDAHQLFGFFDLQELGLFKLLISVSGVGPKVSLGILSSISPHELSNSIMRNDLLKLQKLPGIGKKTAERLVLELRDKIMKLNLNTNDSTAPPLTTESKLFEEATSALISLGYNKSAAEKAVKLSENDFIDKSSQSIEALIKLALKYAMK